MFTSGSINARTTQRILVGSRKMRSSVGSRTVLTEGEKKRNTTPLKRTKPTRLLFAAVWTENIEILNPSTHLIFVSTVFDVPTSSLMKLVATLCCCARIAQQSKFSWSMLLHMAQLRVNRA